VPDIVNHSPFNPLQYVKVLEQLERSHFLNYVAAVCGFSFIPLLLSFFNTTQLKLIELKLCGHS